jgi:hydrogenase maturation protein HypF
MHPEYLSTKFSEQPGTPDYPVQHHHAHVAACLAENEIEPPVLGLAWDGTGYGLDGTIWGGEFFLLNKDKSFKRVAHFRQFPLPGGDRAIKEPRRSALGLLYEIFGDDCWDLLPAKAVPVESEKKLLRQMLQKRVNAPLTSSVGRLFDAVSALAGLRQIATFEGQAAMELEFSRRDHVREAYSFTVTNASPALVDWEPAVRQLLDDIAKGEESGVVSAKFHNGLTEAAVAVAKMVAVEKVVLAGGCFQNRSLAERTVERLRQENHRPYWHRRLPPNDGSISFGQAVVAAWGLDPS